MLAACDGVNVAEHLGKHANRTWFQSERALKANKGQRIDHVIAERSLMDEKSTLFIKGYEVLHDFGGSRKGASDHCPLWFTLQRESVKKVTMAIRKDGQKQVLQDAEFMKSLEKLLEPTTTPKFEEKSMSEAFVGDDEEEGVIELDEEIQSEDILCTTEEDEKRRPFEDCPMPILKCGVEIGSEVVDVRILIDSGSSLDLISGTLARKFRKKGCEVRTIQKGVRIKVANGK